MMQMNMVVKTFERFLRYQTGMGYEDFYNLMPLGESEPMLQKLFNDWIKTEHPTQAWIKSAIFTTSQFGWELKQS